MGVFNNIQIAMDTTLAAVSSVPPIAWSNVEYIPIQGTTFVRPTLMPAGSQMATLNGTSRNPGIYQVDIFSPSGKGQGAALVVADAIKTKFESNRTITAGSNKIFILQVSLGKGERENAWDHIFVEVHYLCIS